MGLAPEPHAAVCAWLQIDAPAPSDLAVAWLERGTSAQRRSGIRHARRGPLRSRAWRWSVLMAVMIEIDPHKGSHTVNMCDLSAVVLAVQVKQGPAPGGPARLQSGRAAWRR